MKLKKEIKRLIFVVLFIIITVIIINLIKSIPPKDTTKDDLLNLGYTESEVTSITAILDEFKIEQILNSEYNDLLPKIITAKYYIPNNYDEYIDYTLNNSSQDVEDIIAIINTSSDNTFYTEDNEITNLSNNMLVNKFNYLPLDYEASNLVNISTMYAYDNQVINSEVNDAYVRMWKQANLEDLVLIVNSSYRTYEEQKFQYDNSSDDYAARPRYSEHETGLALDIITYNNIGNEFASTEEYEWLINNSYKYGFILRYPEGKEHITGYSYESWHYRYLGIELATKVYESGLTYDEYYAYYCEYKNEC